MSLILNRTSPKRIRDLPQEMREHMETNLAKPTRKAMPQVPSFRASALPYCPILDVEATCAVHSPDVQPEPYGFGDEFSWKWGKLFTACGRKT